MEIKFTCQARKQAMDRSVWLVCVIVLEKFFGNCPVDYHNTSLTDENMFFHLLSPQEILM